MAASANITYPTPISIQAAMDNAARSQELLRFIEAAKQAQEITPKTAEMAWSTWNLLRRTLSETLMVPDASYGPDGQFLLLWDKVEHHLELEIEPEGSGYFFYRNRTSGALWETDYSVGDDLCGEIVEKLRMFA